MVFKEINIERYDSDNNLKLDLKSIYSNPDSLFFYYAKSLDWRMKRKKKEFTEMVRNGKYRYPFYLTFFHGKVAYPEAYKKIKDIWYKSNKELSADFGFLSLAKMNDPEVQAEIDKIVSDYIH